MQVGHDPYRAFALLAEKLSVGLAPACGHAPVNAARIVPGHIRAHLFKFEATSALGTAVAAIQLGHGRAVGVEAEAMRGSALHDQIAQVGEFHGAGTSLNSSSIQSCAVVPRAWAV